MSPKASISCWSSESLPKSICATATSTLASRRLRITTVRPSEVLSTRKSPNKPFKSSSDARPWAEASMERKMLFSFTFRFSSFTAALLTAVLLTIELFIAPLSVMALYPAGAPSAAMLPSSSMGFSVWS